MAGSTYAYCYAGCHMPWFITNSKQYDLGAYAGLVGVDHCKVMWDHGLRSQDGAEPRTRAPPRCARAGAYPASSPLLFFEALRRQLGGAVPMWQGEGKWEGGGSRSMTLPFKDERWEEEV